VTIIVLANVDIAAAPLPLDKDVVPDKVAPGEVRIDTPPSLSLFNVTPSVEDWGK
jgi:hypothetical protein